VPVLRRLAQTFGREINITRYSEKEFKQKVQKKEKEGSFPFIGYQPKGGYDRGSPE
jgi:hypothetical protein